MDKDANVPTPVESRVALISGGVRGIGRAVALALAREGWTVAACYRSSVAEAESLESELRAAGARASIMRAELSDPAAAEGVVRSVEGAYGRIDALINCVGAYRRVPLMDETVEGWHSMFDDNLHPVFYLCRAAAPGMIRRGWGRIINFSVVNADRLMGQPYVTAHSIAKTGVLILTRSLAKILAPYGITVNAISPGFVKTGGVPEEELERSFQSIPAGSLGSTEDAVAAVLYLLSDGARYANGTNIHLSGGWGI